MSYATPADLLARFDARTVGQLVGDNNAQVAQPDLLTHPNLQAALDSASGQIEAALLQGERYVVLDLQNLTDNSLAYLKQITCQIAFARLYERRPYNDSKQRGDALDKAEQLLELLRTGKHVFAVQTAIGAGVPKITGPSTLQKRQLNTISDRASGYFYPAPVQPDNR